MILYTYIYYVCIIILSKIPRYDFERQTNIIRHSNDVRENLILTAFYH
jgi:hypothetical protein